MSDYVTVYHRDVCADGFALEDVADAVFLDLPSPWKALPSAKAALKREGGRICSFSPCIEQVQKTVQELTQLGFTDIYTVESLRRVLCVKKYIMQDFDFNMDIRPSKDDNQLAETKDEAQNDTEMKDGSAPKRESTSKPSKPAANKKFRKQKKDESDSELSSDNDDENSTSTVRYAAKPINLQPGHTSYLTFATLLHKDYL